MALLLSLHRSSFASVLLGCGATLASLLAIRYLVHRYDHEATKKWWRKWMSRLFGESRRIIIVGDLHGCFDELFDLLGRPPRCPGGLSYRPGKDILVLCGDLVNKGPDSSGIVQFYRQHQERYPQTVFMVVGNHEMKLFSIYEAEGRRSASRKTSPGQPDPSGSTSSPAPHCLSIIPPAPSPSVALSPAAVTPTLPTPSQSDTSSSESSSSSKQERKKGAFRRMLQELTEDDMAWLMRQPKMLRFPIIPPAPPLSLSLSAAAAAAWGKQQDLVVVHAGLNPFLPLEEQSEWELTHMRNVLVDGRRGVEDDKQGVHWIDLWDGPQLVVYGHDAKKGLYVTQHTIGLDTGCVYGGRLSAVVLPGRHIYSVPARRVHCQPKSPLPSSPDGAVAAAATAGGKAGG
ncbi:unnamed protein product [Vitrella brassicaformis CCMP3155]|uniref:Calcineurin-like phosphoesterase domain-containing protein n=1 Tax=Vitrella brassicaformis (strain CCMP3155) TaxID=1169540 RepID=A0A0G4G3B7_VITBC|nr:unnamed protein product [Vitrella brassicaformis CCMP3155]|eukprot:CEM22757.1 unnamed protein product [Vitrella brassicaformis CCMP3155]